MQVAATAGGAGNGSRYARVPLVLFLTLGLLVSLIRCAGCDLGFTRANASAVVISLDHGSSPDTPEPQSPCHSGHCLSHVTTRHVAAVVTPADPTLRGPSFFEGQSPRSLAELPPFKPPRA